MGKSLKLLEKLKKRTESHAEHSRASLRHENKLSDDRQFRAWMCKLKRKPSSQRTQAHTFTSAHTLSRSQGRNKAMGKESMTKT